MLRTQVEGMSRIIIICKILFNCELSFYLLQFKKSYVIILKTSGKV